MNVIIANYGNGSIALIQWAIENKLPDLHVLSVDTHWQADGWHQHLQNVFSYMARHQVSYQHLQARQGFAQSVKDRRGFPSKKFQWCAPFLKGLTLNEALDDLDPQCEAEVHLAKIATLSRANRRLMDGQPNEHYQDRIVRYPLLALSIVDRDALIHRAGFEVLAHNSLECMPCIHQTKADFQVMHQQDKIKLQQLESEVGQRMFESGPIEHGVSHERFDMGCGNIWSCGD